ncbi:unnamed protein product, partial [Ixodes pacificus]
PARQHFGKTRPQGLQPETQQKPSHSNKINNGAQNVPKYPIAVREVKTSPKIFSNISVPSAPKNRIPGKQNEKFVDSGLLWFPAASKVDSTCDWKIPSNVGCLNRHLAFVHLYPTPPVTQTAGRTYTTSLCGSYAPYSDEPLHPSSMNVDDGSLVTGLFLEKFAVVNPGSYTFEWASHSRAGNLLLAGVPFHRRTLHMCHQHRRVVGKLFVTGDGRKDSRKGIANFFKVCQRLKAHERNNPSRNYWGFPTVPVERLPMAVRVPGSNLGAITPVAPVAAE